MVTIVSFSSRKDGNCQKISLYIKNYVQNANIFSFSNFDISPCGKCSYECFQNRLDCPYIGDMEYSILEAICKSEMAYFILPNYCDYPNANFFMFNERSNCFFQGQAQLLEQYLNVPKRFIVVSNTGKENFRQAFEQHTNQTPEILFLRPKEYGKNSIDGDLLLSDDVERIIRAFL